MFVKVNSRLKLTRAGLGLDDYRSGAA
jgi:hypothetical protein